MIGAEHGAELAHTRGAALDRALVKLVAEDIDAVRSAEIVERFAIEIGDSDAGARLHKGGGRQAIPGDAAELEGHAVGVGELQIGNAAGGFGRLRDGFGKARIVEPGQAFEAGAAARGDVRRCAVAAKEARLVVFVEWNQAGQAAGQPGTADQGFMLGLRQFEAPTQLASEVARAAPPTP